jgi:hypothetical protein
MDWVPDLHDTADLRLPAEVAADLEALAEHVHNVWGAKRLAAGVRTNPNLVPYEKLPQSERDYDREMVAETVRMLLRLGYRIERP